MPAKRVTVYATTALAVMILIGCDQAGTIESARLVDFEPAETSFWPPELCARAGAARFTFAPKLPPTDAVL